MRYALLLARKHDQRSILAVSIALVLMFPVAVTVTVAVSVLCQRCSTIDGCSPVRPHFVVESA